MRRFLFALALLFPVAAHAALPCSAYPNTLTNGTLADANQVMANFNTILNCVNSLAPLGVPVAGTVTNVKASLPTAGTTVTFTADNLILGTALNGTLYTLTSYSQTLNTGTVGAGGMDTGTLPVSSFVGIYAIFNPTAPTTSILATTCASACPTIYGGANMPAGYTASALIGAWPTNATPALVAGYVKNKNYTYSATPTAITLSATHGSLTSLSLSTLVPPDAIVVQLNGALVCGTTPGAAGTNVIVASQSGDVSINQLAFNCNSLTGNQLIGSFQPVPLVTAQTAFYENTVQGTSPQQFIYVIGYLWP